MKSCLFISILAALCGMIAGLTRDYIFYNYAMNWTDASIYCRYTGYMGLACITTTEENAEIMKLAGNSNGWIGMYRKNTTWKWYPSVTSDFASWGVGEPSDVDQNCVLFDRNGWNDRFCEEKVPFYCYRHVILVKQNMTWTEALRYCRFKYTNLACLNTDQKLHFAEIEALPSETSSLWTGLRFLNGYWFCALTGESRGTVGPLLTCPVNNNRCVARNFKTGAWEIRNCEEKLNFLCY